MEILAPAGGQQQLLAAVRCGADAVYLGARGFNARQSAENFGTRELRDSVAYCHSHGVKVHVTVNTLVTDAELCDLEKTAEEVAFSGADAVIVQDPAVMRLFLSRYPTLQVHASTQCAVHNTEGARFFEDMGVKRVVLARELSVDEISKIRSGVSVELEAFIHGALCMCLSGACYLSSLIGGRSGNRGRCAQPCRMDFEVRGRHYGLSLKDMSHLRHLPELMKAGVCSFKIEGRMKRPEYVAAAVTAARLAADGKPYDEEALRAVFSRSGFTDGYATGKRGPAMFGRREKEDVQAAASVLRDLERLYDREKPTVPADMGLTVGSDKSALTVSALGHRAHSTGDGGIVPQSRPTDEELARRSLGKLGGTQFYLNSLTVENPEGLMLPPSAMNSLRREAMEKLAAALGDPAPHVPEPFAFPGYAFRQPEGLGALWCRFEKAEQVFPGPERIILPVSEILSRPELIEKLGKALTAELPPVLFPENEAEAPRDLEKLRELGVRSVWAENAYGLSLGRRLGFEVYGGAGLNVLGSQAAAEYARQGLGAVCCSFECSMAALRSFRSPIPFGYAVYGYLPAMRVRNCPAFPSGGCRGCDGRPHLTDKTGANFTILCHKRRFQTVLNSVPLHLGGKSQAKSDFRLLSFTVEAPEECRRIYGEILSDEAAKGPRTGGLYYRVLQ